jgi:arylesterase/paraoxonase
MKPLTRAFLVAGAMVAVAGLALGLRSLTALGIFTTVQPNFSGQCKAVRGIAGPGDLQVDAKDGLLFIAASDRRRPGPRDGIYTMALRGGTPVRLSGTPKDFHPRGISLYRGQDGALTLMAINRQGDGASSVDIFDVAIKDGRAVLSARAFIQSGLLVPPGAIAAVGPDQFYVTNDSVSHSKPARTLEAYTLLPRGDVIYFNGQIFRIVVKHLAVARGIALSGDGDHVYVASATDRALATFKRNIFTGNLVQVNKFPIHSGLANITRDAKQNLWIAGQPRLFENERFRKDPHAQDASQVFKVTLKDGLPQSVQPVYADDGARIGGASAAVRIGERLIIGSALDDKLLDCTLK